LLSSAFDGLHDMRRWGSHDTAYDSSVSKFTSPIVLANAENLASGGKWAGNANVDPACLGKRKTFVSGEATELSGSGIFYDVKRQRFLFPGGRTGIRGRGVLGRYGPNHAADPIVTRFSPVTGDLEVVVVVRSDCDMIALPGGMVNPGEVLDVTCEPRG
jgi:ADP-ribose pyrophosphatase